MIGAIRRVNPALNTIDFIRIPSHGQKQPPPTAKESVIYRLHPTHEGTKHIFQIGTSDPARAVAAARLVAADVAGIDVNAGCPKPFSTHDGMGAALLQTPDKLVAILEALVAAIVPEFQIGVSVKIRLLDTADKTEALVRRLVATGITALTVHCRTTPMRPRERAIRGQLRMIADVCREAGVACLMNGDVEAGPREAAERLWAEFGVDGAMIATAAEKNASCFRTAALGGLAPWEEVVARYVGFALEVHNKFGNTKYVMNRIVPGKSPLYVRLQSCRSYVSICETLGLSQLLDQARVVDVALGITVETQSVALNGTSTKRKSEDTEEEGKVEEQAASKRLCVGDEPSKENSAPESVQSGVALSA